VTPEQIKQARESLGLTPEEIAPLLGYGHRSRIYELENGERNIGASAELLLRAYLSGYRPDDWPAEKG